MHKSGNPVSKAKSWREHNFEISPFSAAVTKAAKVAQEQIKNKIPIQVNKKTWVYPKSNIDG